VHLFDRIIYRARLLSYSLFFYYYLIYDLQLTKTSSQNTCGIYGHKKFLLIIHGNNDFTEGSKILLDTDLKIIFLDYQNNFVEILKIISMLQKIWIF